MLPFAAVGLSFSEIFQKALKEWLCFARKEYQIPSRSPKRNYHSMY